MRHVIGLRLVGLWLAVVWAMPAWAQPSYEETRVGTRFQVYVPPNNEVSGRYSAIVITALSGDAAQPVLVELVDDAADGDDDDTVSASLVRGESLVRYIKDGAVNDDYQGKWDGDYMRVSASSPVAVMLVTDSDWQHDWAPADNGTLRGTSFYVWANRTSSSARDINAFAYEPGTRVSLYDITDNALTGSGVARVRADRGAPLLQVDMEEGEDLIVRRGLGLDLLQAGRSYQIVATRPITLMTGALGGITVTGGVRDGGGFVPGRDGRSRGDDFYFTIPHDKGRLSEQELRIVSYDDGVVSRLEGWDEATSAWRLIRQDTLNRLGHADHVGGAYRLYRLRATGGEVALYEANWMETGSVGTSDELDFGTGRYGSDGSYTALIYLGPPGNQGNSSVADESLTHLYLFSLAGNAGVRVRDADTQGMLLDTTALISAGGMADVRISAALYAAMNRPAEGIRPYVLVESPSPIALAMSNWNDNWMAYATAVVVRNPVTTLVTPRTLVLGQQATITGGVVNSGTVTLTDARAELTLPPGVDYVGGTMGGAAASSVTASATGTRVVYALGTLAPEQEVALSAQVVASAGTSGEVLPLALVAGGYDSALWVATGDSSPVTLVVPAVPTLSGLVAQPGSGRVGLSWVVDASLSSQPAQLVVERATQAAGPYVQVGQVGQTTPGAAAQSWTWEDTGLTNGQVRYYRVVALAPGGQRAQAGPVSAVPLDNGAPGAPGLAGQGADSRVTLTITPPADNDVVGYHIEREVSPGLWVRLTGAPWPSLMWTQAGLVNGQDYRWRARAVDAQGNIGAASPAVQVAPVASAGLVAEQQVAFEDMLGAGNNDWDYNDFIVSVVSRRTLSGGGVTELELEYVPQARGAGYIHALRQALPLTGAWEAVVIYFDPMDPLVQRRVESYSGTGELDVPIWEDTREALAPQVGSFTNTDSSQAAFVAGERALLLVRGLDPASNPVGGVGAPPWDIYLKMPYMAAGADEVHLPQYQGPAEPVLEGELAGWTLPFALVLEEQVGAERWWSFEGAAVWKTFPEFSPWVRTGSAQHDQWHRAPGGAHGGFSNRR
jgi:LruC domain-containing protein